MRIDVFQISAGVVVVDGVVVVVVPVVVVVVGVVVGQGSEMALAST